LTFSTPAANTAPVVILGETCPPYTAVLFAVSGGTLDNDYAILVRVQTSASQTRDLYCPLLVRDE
jgi:hypothetical protein